MKHLKKVSLAFTLMFVLATAAIAGETSSPPCIPGETSSPPCVSEAITDETSPTGERQSSPELASVSATGIAETILWSLLLV